MKINVNVTGIKEVQRNLARIKSELQQGKAMAMAINKVAEKAQVEIRRAITERYAIKAADVRGSLGLRRATNNRGGSVEAVIDVFGSPSKKGRSMNMVRFLAAVQAAGAAMKTRGAKANKAQLKALEQQLGFAIKRGGGLKTIPGAFLGNKGRTIFMRTGDKRLPIKAVQVIGVSQMFSSKEISRRVMAKIDKDLEVEVARAIEAILARTK
jgi:hypothetical protein